MGSCVLHDGDQQVEEHKVDDDHVHEIPVHAMGAWLGDGGPIRVS